jgi:hypothetical protein
VAELYLFGKNLISDSLAIVHVTSVHSYGFFGILSEEQEVFGPHSGSAASLIPTQLL